MKNQHGEIITAKYVVITVPLTILKDRDITFVPELPADKNRAINTIKMLGAWKIICQFKRRFWPEKLHQIYSVRGFSSEIWMWSRSSSVKWLLGLKPLSLRNRKVASAVNRSWRGS